MGKDVLSILENCIGLHGNHLNIKVQAKLTMKSGTVIVCVVTKIDHAKRVVMAVGMNDVGKVGPAFSIDQLIASAGSINFDDIITAECLRS
jgi:hypothetical protein